MKTSDIDDKSLGERPLWANVAEQVAKDLGLPVPPVSSTPSAPPVTVPAPAAAPPPTPSVTTPPASPTSAATPDPPPAPSVSDDLRKIREELADLRRLIKGLHRGMAKLSERVEGLSAAPPTPPVPQVPVPQVPMEPEERVKPKPKYAPGIRDSLGRLVPEIREAFAAWLFDTFIPLPGVGAAPDGAEGEWYTCEDLTAMFEFSEHGREFPAGSVTAQAVCSAVTRGHTEYGYVTDRRRARRDGRLLTYRLMFPSGHGTQDDDKTQDDDDESQEV